MIFLCIRLLAVLLFAGAYHSPAHAQNWPSFAGGARRLGVNPTETRLTPATVAGLKQHWKTWLGIATDTQPLFIRNVTIGGATHDEVFQATSGGDVYALDAATGAIDWRTRLPLSQALEGSCAGGGYGVRGTPTIDTTTNTMYVVDGNGALHGLDITDGREMPNYPVQVIDRQNLYHGAFNHSSPTLVGRMLYVTTSGRGSCEDKLVPYFGAVIAFDTTLKSVAGRFFPLTNTTGGAGIWGPGGALADSVTGRLFVGTGNALGIAGYKPLAVSVVALDLGLDVVDSHSPTKPLLNPKLDLDFASTPTPIDVPGCPPLLSIMNKDGKVFVYNRTALAAGPVQILHISTGDGRSAFLGMAAFDPAARMLFINNPDASPDGLITNGGVAYRVSPPGCLLDLAWQTTYGTNLYSHHTRATDPTVAGGLVWVVTGLGESVLALSEATGEPLWMSSPRLVGAPTQTPVTVANGQMFVQVGDVLQAWGL